MSIDIHKIDQEKKEQKMAFVKKLKMVSFSLFLSFILSLLATINNLIHLSIF